MLKSHHGAGQRDGVRRPFGRRPGSAERRGKRQRHSRLENFNRATRAREQRPCRRCCGGVEPILARRPAREGLRAASRRGREFELCTKVPFDAIPQQPIRKGTQVPSKKTSCSGTIFIKSDRRAQQKNLLQRELNNRGVFDGFKPSPCPPRSANVSKSRRAVPVLRKTEKLGGARSVDLRRGPFRRQPRSRFRYFPIASYWATPHRRI